MFLCCILVASFLDDKGEVVTCVDKVQMHGSGYQRGFVYNYFKSFKDEIPVDYTGYRVEFYIATLRNRRWSDKYILTRIYVNAKT